MIVCAIEPEYKGKDNAAKVTRSSCEPWNDSIIGGMNVWYDCKVGTVTCIGENGTDADSGDEGVYTNVRDEAYNCHDDALNKSTL